MKEDFLPLNRLFDSQVADIYYAEKQLVKALPKMAEASQNPKLKEAFENHLKETQGHVHRLEAVFAALKEKPHTNRCKAILGLIEEAEEMADEFKETHAIDAALIAAAQKVEHYEIATYGTLRNWAEILEEKEAVSIFEITLEEEKTADSKLNELAESQANLTAV